MMRAPDEVDLALLRRIEEIPGHNISDIVRPFLLERSESVLRGRIRGLELRRFIKTVRTKSEVQCYPAAEELTA